MARQASDTAGEFKALKENILSGDYAPVYLFFGKEHYYIDQLCNLLIDNVVPEEQRDFGQIVLYGADVTAEQVVSAARQFPMMSQRQLVVVKEAQMMRKFEDIGVYFSGIMPTTVLVLCYKTPNDPTKSSKNVDKRTSFFKQAQKVGVVFESNQIPDYKMPRWIESYVSEKGLKIMPDASALLSEFAGVDMQKIALEIDKLVKLLPEGTKTITAGDIEKNVGMSRDYSVFELTKALSMKDSVKAFRIVKFFSESSKRYPLVVVLAALSSHFLRLLKYHALLQEETPRGEILSQLGVNPYFASEYDTAIRNYPARKVMKAISLLRQTDSKSKSGLRGEAGDGELLQELVSKILFL
ncbi:MAG: DNA polymerase III subunit delta [Bacteroidales bacterium]|nr:DNA polymerase III subunit delta [Candidatus Cacconaster merdequi]